MAMDHNTAYTEKDRKRDENTIFMNNNDFNNNINCNDYVSLFMTPLYVIQVFYYLIISIVITYKNVIYVKKRINNNNNNNNSNDKFNSSVGLFDTCVAATVKTIGNNPFIINYDNLVTFIFKFLFTMHYLQAKLSLISFIMDALLLCAYVSMTQATSVAATLVTTTVIMTTMKTVEISNKMNNSMISNFWDIVKCQILIYLLFCKQQQ